MCRAPLEGVSDRRGQPSTVDAHIPLYQKEVDQIARSRRAALIDRLVHHCHLVTIRGNSYRMRQHTELWHALHSPHDADPPSGRRRRTRQEVATP